MARIARSRLEIMLNSEEIVFSQKIRAIVQNCLKDESVSFFPFFFARADERRIFHEKL